MRRTTRRRKHRCINVASNNRSGYLYMTSLLIIHVDKCNVSEKASSTKPPELTRLEGSCGASTLLWCNTVVVFPLLLAKINNLKTAASGLSPHGVSWPYCDLEP